MNQPHDRIQIDFRYSDIPLGQLFGVVQRRNRKWSVLHVVAQIAWWSVQALGLLGLFQLINGYVTNGIETAIIAFAAGTCATILTLLFLNRPLYLNMIQAMKNAPSRTAGMRAVLDPTGVTLIGTGSRVSHSWKTVTDIIVAHDTTLIMPSQSEFYAIPHIGLPPDLSPEALAARIDEWRKAAERNPWPDQPPFSSTVMESLPTAKAPPSLF